jgi:4,5-DOPA dioxygenase extradiol
MNGAVTRRDLLRSLAAGGALAAVGGPAAFADGSARPAARPRMPVAFVGHGSPTTVLDATRGGEWTRWTAAFPRPASILVVSAHWERAPATVGATTAVPLVYDFYGFPREMYALRYPAPGSPGLARRVGECLAPLGGVRSDPGRGLDHGAWCPLRWMYRDADVPVLSLSLPTQDPARLVALGRALAPLRDEGVLVLGSGNVVHNLRALGRDGTPPPAWSKEFDEWTSRTVAARDLDALVDWRRKAPGAREAHPTAEHWTPLLVASGAGVAGGGDVRFPVVGFEAGSVSRRCVQFG